jgi:hypothetical protein
LGAASAAPLTPVNFGAVSVPAVLPPVS